VAALRVDFVSGKNHFSPPLPRAGAVKNQANNQPIPCMSLFKWFRTEKPKPKPPPSPFETLAAMSRFQEVEERSPAFFQKYYHPICMTVGFLGFLKQQHEFFRFVFSCNVAGIPAQAASLEDGFRRMNLEARTVDFIDNTMTTLMKVLLPVVQDPECPPYLKDCVWPIAGALEIIPEKPGTP